LVVVWGGGWGGGWGGWGGGVGGVGVGVEDGGVPVPPQTAPFSCTFDGGGVADPFATNPTDTSLPVPRDAFQDGAAAVTVVPDCVTVAFHPLTIVVPAGSENVTFHGETAAPLLRTVTEPW